MTRSNRWKHLATAVFALVPAFCLWSQEPQGQPNDNPLKDARDGLTVNKPSAYQGYTLVAPMNSTSTYLVDMEGRIVNEWKSDFTPGVSAYLLENGHLLRPGAERDFGTGGPGAGGRIQEFTWDGDLVWDYSFGDSKLRPHHDICRLPNGNVLAVASDPKTRDEAIAAGRRPESVRTQLVPDCILEIKPTGKTTGEIVWEWHAWDHLVQDADKKKPNYGDVSEHPELIDVNFSTGMMDRMLQDPDQLARLRSLGYVGGGNASPPKANSKNDPNSTPAAPKKGEPAKTDPPSPPPVAGAPGPFGPGGPGRGGPPGGPFDGDWMHVNSVAYNAQLDQIMLSVHEFHEVWVIDHSTTTAEAASHKGGSSGKGGDLLYRWGNPKAYRSGTNVDQRLFGQHSAHWIDDGLPGAGNLLVFNNGNQRPDGAYSTVDEIVLPLNKDGTYEREEYMAFGPDKPKWSFASSDKPSFYSMLISGAQRLANGNTLICSGNQAILFEVTPDGEIVWQYKHPGGGFGPGGPFPMGFPFGGFRPPRVGEIMPQFLADRLELTEEQKTKIQKLQQQLDEDLNQIWTDTQKNRIKEMQNGFGGGPGFGRPFGFGGPPGPGGPPGGGGPGRVQGPGPGGPQGPGGPPRGPGGIFRSYRYGTDYPGLAGKRLTPGKKLAEVAAPNPRPAPTPPSRDSEPEKSAK